MPAGWELDASVDVWVFGLELVLLSTREDEPDSLFKPLDDNFDVAALDTFKTVSRVEEEELGRPDELAVFLEILSSSSLALCTKLSAILWLLNLFEDNSWPAVDEYGC